MPCHLSSLAGMEGAVPLTLRLPKALACCKSIASQISKQLMGHGEGLQMERM